MNARWRAVDRLHQASEEIATSTGLIIAIVVVALIVIASICVASSRSESRKREERREVAGRHRDEARQRHVKADKHEVAADEKARPCSPRDGRGR